MNTDSEIKMIIPPESNMRINYSSQSMLKILLLFMCIFNIRDIHISAKSSWFIGPVEKKKLYTLKQDETIEYGKFILDITYEYETYGIGIKSKDSVYCLINGNIIGPYDTDGTHQLTLKPWTYSAFKKDKYYYITSSGKELGPFDNSKDIRQFAQGENRWSVNVRKDRKKYILFSDGILTGPYEDTGIPVISPDGKSYAYTVTNSGKSFIVINGKESGPYENPSIPSICNNGKAFAFSFKHNGKYFVSLNGAEKGPYDIAGRVYLSNRGEHTGYKIIKHGKFFTIVDGKDYGPYDTDSNNISDPVRFSADETSWAFRRYSGGKGYMVINGAVKGPYENLTEILFAPVISQYIYYYSNDPVKKDSYYIVSGTKYDDPREYGPYEFIKPEQGEYIPGSSAWKTFAVKKEKKYILANGRETGPYDFNNIRALVMHGGIIGFTGQRDSGSWIVIGDSVYGPYAEPIQFGFGSDGRNFYYTVKTEHDTVLYVNGKELARNPFSVGLYRSKDGEYLYWFTQEGKDIFLNRMQFYEPGMR
jgi:hypothetical protein